MCDFNSAWKEKAKLLEAENKALMDRINLVAPVTGYPICEISWDRISTLLNKYGLVLITKVEYSADNTIYYTDEMNWIKILPYITYPADAYVLDGADCDDYTKKASADSAMIFKLNGCFQCWGHVMIDGERKGHAFNLVWLPGNIFKLFEPNAAFSCAGSLFYPEETEYQYHPESWMF